MLRKLWELTYQPEAPAWYLYLFWLLFGNADDGPYGTGTAARFSPIDLKAAAKWWFRNPAHNVFCRLLIIEYTEIKVLYGTPDVKPGGRPFWPFAGHVLVLMVGGPFISFRTDKWEGYAGFRPRGPGAYHTTYGGLGFTLRKRKVA